MAKIEKFTLSTQQDTQDFTNGCCFFGTGGGGNAEFGQAMLTDALNAGKKIQIIDTETIRNKDWIVCPYLMGTSGPETDKTKQDKLKYGLLSKTVGNMPTAATQLLLKQSTKLINLSAIIPYEIGGAATASAVATAAWLGVPTLDADFVGRSVPEATQMLPAIYGLDLCPTASSDAFGNESIIHKALNRNILERMGKYLASASFGLIGQATLLRQAHELKNFMLPDTLSKAFSVGKKLRLCRENNADMAQAPNSLIGAQKIFEGSIAKIIGGDEEGYYVGEIIIHGINDYKNSKLKIWFKNENHIAWINDNIAATSPDLISVIDKSSYLPLVNNQLKNGMKIDIYATPTHSAWLNNEALKVNCPKYYGIDVEPKLISPEIK